MMKHKTGDRVKILVGAFKGTEGVIEMSHENSSWCPCKDFDRPCCEEHYEVAVVRKDNFNLYMLYCEGELATE